MKKVFIRVDANEKIATGHVMRCLSIAQAIKKMNIESVFIVSDERSLAILEGKPYETYVLGSVWDDLSLEIDCLTDYLMEQEASFLLIDSYFVNPNYLVKLKEIVHVMYIDDMEDIVYPVSTVLNYSWWQSKDISINSIEEYKGKYDKENINTLIGPCYAPIREEFYGKQTEIREEVKRILVSTGGTDQLGLALKLLNKLSMEDIFYGLEFDIIVGKFAKTKAELEKLSIRYSNIHVHENVQNMSYWMVNSDIAVAAAGTTLYELAACGLPTICVEVADNQYGARCLEEEGYMMYAGKAYKDIDKTIDKVVTKLKRLIADADMRIKMSKREKCLVDGCGSERIAEYIRSVLFEK